MKALEHKLAWGRPRYDVISRRFYAKEHESHSRRIREAKGVIKITPPPDLPHLKYNPKKLQVIEDQKLRLETDNRLLVQRISEIMRTPAPAHEPAPLRGAAYDPVSTRTLTGSSTGRRLGPKTLNLPHRQREAARIRFENQLFLERLDRQRAVVPTRDELAREFAVQEHHMRTLSLLPQFPLLPETEQAIEEARKRARAAVRASQALPRSGTDGRGAAAHDDRFGRTDRSVADTMGSPHARHTSSPPAALRQDDFSPFARPSKAQHPEPWNASQSRHGDGNRDPDEGLFAASDTSKRLPVTNPSGMPTRTITRRHREAIARELARSASAAAMNTATQPLQHAPSPSRGSQDALAPDTTGLSAHAEAAGPVPSKHLDDEVAREVSRRSMAAAQRLQAALAQEHEPSSRFDGSQRITEQLPPRRLSGGTAPQQSAHATGSISRTGTHLHEGRSVLRSLSHGTARVVLTTHHDGALQPHAMSEAVPRS